MAKANLNTQAKRQRALAKMDKRAAKDEKRAARKEEARTQRASETGTVQPAKPAPSPLVAAFIRSMKIGGGKR